MEKPDVIEIQKDLLPYECEMVLGETLFVLQFNYNATADLFTVDLYKDGELICAGEPIVYGVKLWSDVYRAGDFPAIDIIPLDLSGESSAVTYDNLCESVLLAIDDGGEEVGADGGEL